MFILQKQLVQYSWFKKFDASQKIKFTKKDETIVFSKASFSASQQSRKSQQEQETTIDGEGELRFSMCVLILYMHGIEGASETVEKDEKVKSVKTLPPPPKKEKKKKLELVGLTMVIRKHHINNSFPSLVVN